MSSTANREEAERCLSIARSKWLQGDKEGAIRFTKKSLALFPELKEAEKLLREYTTQPTESEGVRQRRKEESNVPTERSYTPDQLQAVKEWQKLDRNDLYACLGLERGASDADIKRAYRKQALLFHPDKNGAPGADEAFKGIGRAFAILSDSQKKEQYDRFGLASDRDTSSSGAAAGESTYAHPMADIFAQFAQQQHRGGPHVFQGEIDPEELFNLFFGAAMNGVDMQRFAQRQQRQRQQRQQRHQQQAQSPFANIISMAPLLLFFLFSFLSSLFSSASTTNGMYADRYRLDPLDSFSYQRFTSYHKIPYYVTSNVHQQLVQRERMVGGRIQGTPSRDPVVRAFEQEVETAFIERWQPICRDKNKSNSLPGRDEACERLKLFTK